MSYQIKSTPFFRRLVSTSKKNGQLQKLKDEYERIQEFNDRAIEMKMRQVRLKRLFREIEEIKDSSLQWKKRRMSTERMKTAEELRHENLHRAKELGKEYSKLNGLIAERCAVPRMEQSASGLLAVSSSYARTEGEKKARSVKRIRYGNEISRSNIQKIRALLDRKSTTPKLTESKVAMAHRKEQLKQRLTYGNSCSSLNMTKIPKRSMRYKIATEFQADSCSTPPSAGTPPPVDTVAFNESVTSNQNQNNNIADTDDNDSDTFYQKDMGMVFKKFEDLRNSKIQINASSQMNTVDENARVRARKHWRNLSLTVCNRFDTGRRRPITTLYLNQSQIQQQSEKTVDTEFEEEFKLRHISNDRNLPTMSLINVSIDMHQNDDGGEENVYEDNDTEVEAEHEVLININALNRTVSPQKIMVENASSSTMAMTMATPTRPTNIMAAFNASDEAEATAADPVSNPNSVPLADISKKVQKYVKMFEPYVREAAEKEAYEYGVNKLRSIFEHQGE